MAGVHGGVFGHVSGGENPFLVAWQTIGVLGVLCGEPFAIGLGLVDGDVYNRIVVFPFGVGKICLEGGVFGIGDGGAADVGVLGRGAAQYHPGVVRILVPAGVDESEELLLYAGVAVLDHFVHDVLHFLYEAISFRLTLQFPEFVFLSCDHFVVAEAHLLQEGLFVGFRRILAVLEEKAVRFGVHFGPLFLDERSIGFVKFQLAFHLFVRTDECAALHGLMDAEIVGDKSVAVKGEPVTSVKVARQGGDVVIFSRREAGFVGGVESDDGACVFNAVCYRLTLRVISDDCPASQWVAVDAFQFHFRYARKPNVELDSAAHCGVAFVSVVFVCLHGQNFHRVFFAVLLGGHGNGRDDGHDHR